eukprot:TRINITY_DN6390_c0_g1_i2.p1 TRINITY_DN6390_c0_g1~~TRINITY_DN6390_c0_g1_i2.p1  ORF type:complete len:223 (-),score=42.00 TRINITY_DN6390_c0_g1_i2:395-1063(-)
MGGLTISSWLSALQALLPPGLALTLDPSARLTRLLEAIAAQMAAAQGRFDALLVEWDPRRATTMLTDWERFLGLPDDCMADVALSLNDRRVVAFQRLTERGGQSRSYFLDIAARFGEQDAQIGDGFRPMNCGDNCQRPLYSDADRYVWYVLFNHPAANARPMNCSDDCSDALQSYTPSLAECPINERKPAHTTVLYAYMETSAEVIDQLAQFALVDTLVLAP